MTNQRRTGRGGNGYPVAVAAPLFDQPPARSNDPWTSKAAALQSASLITEHQRLIIAALSLGPASKDGIAARSGIDGVQVCRRLPELQKRNVIELTGRTIASESGRHAREWRLTERAR